jgi:tRNA threonylcarbamoyl adenosine modification protein YeaZ
MTTLGIELSSRQGSVALLKDGDLLAEKSWIAERVRHNTVFQTLDDLMQTTGVSYNDISLYAVGRGPGSFSGMRMSFAIAQALALPGKTEVRAVSSGAALALHVARTVLSAQDQREQAGMPAPQKIAVVGDARRGQIWLGLFKPTAKGRDRTRTESPPAEGCPTGRGGFVVTQTGDWALVPYDEVSIPEKTIVVSPEAERLEKTFPGIGEARFPHAKEVAELALMQPESEPLDPLYLHPPVFTEPK